MSGWTVGGVRGRAPVWSVAVLWPAVLGWRARVPGRAVPLVEIEPFLRERLFYAIMLGSMAHRAVCVAGSAGAAGWYGCRRERLILGECG